MWLSHSLPDPSLALPLQQHPAYAAGLRRDAVPTMVSDAEGPLAYALVLRGLFRCRITLRGPIWLRDVPASQQADALRLLSLRMIEAEAPISVLRQCRFHAITTAGSIAEWDLQTPRALRISAMARKWRYSWRKAASTTTRTSVQRYHGTTDHPLFSLVANAARHKGYRPLPTALTRTLAQSSDLETRIFTATRNDGPIAHMMFIRHGPVVTYHLAWTSPEGRGVNAHHLLLADAAEDYARRGCTRLDLGSVDTEAAPGLARFKIGTGAVVRRLGGGHIRFRR